MNEKRKEVIRDVLIGVGFGILLISFIVLCVNYVKVDIESKVYVNYVPNNVTVPNENANTFVDSVDSAKKSVVEINATLPNGKSAGSGVFYASDAKVSYIVTNFHVIENASQFKVILYDGTVIDDVQLVGGDDVKDIAVLLVKGQYPTVNIRQVVSGNEIKLGETVFAIGNPLGQLGGSVTKGIISCLNRAIKVENSIMNLMQTDVAINSGNSGGGLFDINGNLIGIVNAKVSATGVEGIAFAISIDNVTKIADELIERHSHDALSLEVTQVGYIEGRIDLGFNAAYTTVVTGMFLTETALWVLECDANSPAYQKGIRQYDKILSMSKSGKESLMTSNDAYQNFIKDLKIGNEIKVKVLRSDGEKIFNITVQQKIYKIKK